MTQDVILVQNTCLSSLYPKQGKLRPTANWREGNFVITSLTRCFTDCWPPPAPHTLSMRFPPLLMLSSTVARSSAALKAKSVLKTWLQNIIKCICNFPQGHFSSKLPDLWEEVRVISSMGTIWIKNPANKLPTLSFCHLYTPGHTMGKDR